MDPCFAKSARTFSSNHTLSPTHQDFAVRHLYFAVSQPHSSDVSSTKISSIFLSREQRWSTALEYAREEHPSDGLCKKEVTQRRQTCRNSTVVLALARVLTSARLGRRRTLFLYVKLVPKLRWRGRVVDTFRPARVCRRAVVMALWSSCCPALTGGGRERSGCCCH